MQLFYKLFTITVKNIIMDELSGLFTESFRVNKIVTPPAEGHKIFNNILPLPPAVNMMYIYRRATAGFTENNVLFSVIKVPVIYFSVRFHTLVSSRACGYLLQFSSNSSNQGTKSSYVPQPFGESNRL